MTIGTVTMNGFGWCAILMELCCVTLKDCYLWKDAFSYRYGVRRNVGMTVIFLCYLAAEAASEYGSLTGTTAPVAILLALLLLTVYLLTENGFAIMGLTLIYWLVSYLPWLILETATTFFPMSEGSVSYYQTPGRILPNIVILLLSFFTMCFLWKRRVLHKISPKFCIALCLFTNSTVFLRVGGPGGKNRLTLQQVLGIAATLLLYTILPLGMLLFYSIRQKQKTKIAEICRRQFYEQISKIQHEAGKFRHDLANHMQVINRYREEDILQDIADATENNCRGQESQRHEQQLQQNESQEYGQKLQQYGQKLQQRKSELETGSYSGEKRMDFILEQIRQLALARGCVLEIRGEADENGGKIEGTDQAESITERYISEKEMEELTDRCLEAVASRSFWWIVGKYSGKKMKETLRIFRKDGTLHGRIRRR